MLLKEFTQMDYEIDDMVSNKLKHAYIEFYIEFWELSFLLRYAEFWD